MSHLKSVHRESDEAYQVKYQRQQEKEKADKSEYKQAIIIGGSMCPWDINDAPAQHINRLVIQMIALDNQPFSVVEDPGFI